MVFLYDGAHLVLLCIPLPSLTGRVESTRGLPFAGNISENAAKWNKRWRESTHTPESKTPHSLMRFRYSFDNVPGNLFAPGASSQGPGRQEGQMSECLPFAGDVTETAAKWNQILWELFSPFPPQGSNPWAAHFPRNQIHSAPSAAVRSAPWRQQQYSRGVATLLSPKPPPPSPGPLFFVFVFPLPPAGFRPLGRPLSERSKPHRPAQGVVRCEVRVLLSALAESTRGLCSTRRLAFDGGREDRRDCPSDGLRCCSPSSRRIKECSSTNTTCPSSSPAFWRAR